MHRWNVTGEATPFDVVHSDEDEFVPEPNTIVLAEGDVVLPDSASEGDVIHVRGFNNRPKIDGDGPTTIANSMYGSPYAYTGFIYAGGSWHVDSFNTDITDVDAQRYRTVAYSTDAGDEVNINSQLGFNEIFSINADSSIRAIEYTEPDEYLIFGGMGTDVHVHEIPSLSESDVKTDPDSTVVDIATTTEGGSLSSAVMSVASWTEGTVYYYTYLASDGFFMTETVTLPDDDNVLSIEYNPEGTLLACGSDSGSVYIYETDDWTLEEELSQASDSVSDIDFSEGGEYLGYPSTDGSVYLHNVSDWSIHDEYDEGFGDMTTFSFENSTNFPNYAYGAGTDVIVRGVEEGDLVKELTAPSQTIETVVHTHVSDGYSLLGIGGFDGTVYLYDFDSAAGFYDLAHRIETGGDVRDIAFSAREM